MLRASEMIDMWGLNPYGRRRLLGPMLQKSKVHGPDSIGELFITRLRIGPLYKVSKEHFFLFHRKIFLIKDMQH